MELTLKDLKDGGILMIKLTQKEFLKEVDGKQMAIIAHARKAFPACSSKSKAVNFIKNCESKVMSYLETKEELEKVKAEAEYHKVTSCATSFKRGDSSLYMKGFRIEKVMDDLYILKSIEKVEYAVDLTFVATIIVYAVK